MRLAPSPHVVALTIAVLLVGPAQAQVSSKERLEAFGKLPDWSGLWEPAPFVGEGAGQQLTAEGSRAGAALSRAQMPFTAEWQAKYDAAVRAREAAIAADPAHPPGPTYNNCGSPPFLTKMSAPSVFEWLVTPEETTIVDTIGMIRHIYTDGRAHPPADELWPTRVGDSVGRWQGDTLVVDTVAIKPDVVLFNQVPIQMSDQLHLIERMRRVNRDTLTVELTVDDPIALTKPFEITLTYARVIDTNRMIDETECDAVTDRNPIVNGRFTTIPTR